MPPKEWKCRSGIHTAEKPCASANFAPSRSSRYLPFPLASASLAKYSRLKSMGRAGVAAAETATTSDEDCSTTRRPRESVQSSSRTEMSNDTLVTASHTPSDGTPSCRSMPAKKFRTAPCGTITPLGRPVDPDVKMT